MALICWAGGTMVTATATMTKMKMTKNMMSTMMTTKMIFKVNCPDGMVARPVILKHLPDEDTKVQCLNPIHGKQTFEFVGQITKVFVFSEKRMRRPMLTFDLFEKRP